MIRRIVLAALMMELTGCAETYKGLKTKFEGQVHSWRSACVLKCPNGSYAKVLIWAKGRSKPSKDACANVPSMDIAQACPDADPKAVTCGCSPWGQHEGGTAEPRPSWESTCALSCPNGSRSSQVARVQRPEMPKEDGCTYLGNRARSEGCSGADPEAIGCGECSPWRRYE